MRQMDGGWVKIRRGIFRSPGMKAPNVGWVFVWCVCEALVYEDRARGLSRGQFRTTSSVGANECGISRSAWNRAIEHLVSVGSITVNADSHGTTITVCNYDTYQLEGKERGQPVDNQRTAGGQPSFYIRIEECKNG